MPERHDRGYRALRVWEFIVCAICFGLAISTFVKPLSEFLKAVLLITSSSYLFLTIVDLIMISASKSIPWMPWVPLAITASLLFFLCSGFLLFAKSDIQSVVYEIILISFLVGGILFLLDVILILHAPFLTPEEIQNASPIIKTASLKSSAETEHIHKSVQTEMDIVCNVTTKKELFMEPETSQSPTRDYHMIRKTPTIFSSHGGTFHVSKTVVPISSIRTINSEISKADICECEVTRLRSVGIGVRPVTKQQEEPSKIPIVKPTTPAATQSHCPKSRKSEEEKTAPCQASQTTHHCERMHRVRRNADEAHQQPSDTSKTNDYTVYQFAITTDSEKSTGSSSPDDPKSKPYESILTSPRFLSTLDEELDIDRQSKTRKKCKSARTILEIPENKTSESDEYRLKLYSLLYPRKQDLTLQSTSFNLPEQNFSRALPTLLPGEIESAELSETVHVRKQIISSEPSRTKKYAKVSKSNKPQRSSSATNQSKEDDKKKKNCPFI